MEWSDERPCPSERTVDRVTSIIAPYCSRGGPSKVEKEAAAIVWEEARFEIFNWTFSYLMNVWSADLDRLLDVEADGVVRGFSMTLLPCVPPTGSLMGARWGALMC